MKTIELYPHEVKQALTGSVLIVRPLEPQPKLLPHTGRDGKVWTWDIKNGAGWDESTEKPQSILICGAFPYRPGDRLAGLEKWSDFWMQEDVYDPRLQAIHYRESWDGALADDPPWQSASEMPPELSRITLIVETVEVRRVQTITVEEAAALGLRPYYADMRSLSGISPLNNWQQLVEELFNETHGPDVWQANPWCAFVGAKGMEMETSDGENKR